MCIYVLYSLPCADSHSECVQVHSWTGTRTLYSLPCADSHSECVQVHSWTGTRTLLQPWMMTLITMTLPTNSRMTLCYKPVMEKCSLPNQQSTSNRRKRRMGECGEMRRQRRHGRRREEALGKPVLPAVTENASARWYDSATLLIHTYL